MNVIISFLFFKNYIARGHVPLPERERALPCGVWSQCNLFSSISLSCCFSSHQAQCLNLSQPCEILLLRRFHGAAGLAQSCILSLWWQLNQCGDRAMERPEDRICEENTSTYQQVRPCSDSALRSGGSLLFPSLS